MKTEIKFDKIEYIEMLVFAHLMIYESKTIVVSKDAKKIMKTFKMLYGFLLKETGYAFTKDMIRQKELPHIWFAMIKDIQKPEEIMGVCGEKLLFILDNPGPDLIDIVKGSCCGEYNHYVIIEDEQCDKEDSVNFGKYWLKNEKDLLRLVSRVGLQSVCIAVWMAATYAVLKKGSKPK